MNDHPAKRSVNGVWRYAAILLLTVVAYLPALQSGFIWDDDDYVTRNETLRSVSGLRQIWFEPGATHQYYPLVHTTFWLEYQLWGLAPFGYHLVNVLLHVLAALLLWRLLARLQVRGAWLAAAIFALHPVAVESVAWITERKNVLSGACYFGAALAYLRFQPAGQPGQPARRWWPWYPAALLLFVAALLSKTVTCSLPAAILLVSWWKQGRLQWRDVWPTVPLFALGLALGLHTAWLEEHSVGAQGTQWALTFGERCLIAGRALWFYAAKLIWPANLTFMYPRWALNTGVWWQWLFPALAVVVVGLLWRWRQRLGRGPLVGVLFFAGTLAPALGFINMFPMRYSFVADHFQYLAMVGLIALVAAGLSRWPRFPSPILLAALGILTWRQTHIYRDLETLWRDTLAKNPRCWMAHTNLGMVLAARGEWDEAERWFREALVWNPDGEEALLNMGGVQLRKGLVNEAIAYCRRALQAAPNNSVALYNLGCALLQGGQVADAIECFQRTIQQEPQHVDALSNLAAAWLEWKRYPEAVTAARAALLINPRHPGARLRLGLALVGTGATEEAIREFQELVRHHPNQAPAHVILARLLAARGQFAEARPHYAAAIQADPQNAAAHSELGSLLTHEGDRAGAMAQWREAVRIEPNRVEAMNNLAWALATHPDDSLRNGAEAVTLAEQAVRLTESKQPAILDTLAVAYAATGRFHEALDTAQKALDLATATGNETLARDIRAHREAFQAGLPVREPAPAPRRGE